MLKRKREKDVEKKKRKAADHFLDAKVDFEKHSSLHVSYKGNFTRNRQKWGEGGRGMEEENNNDDDNNDGEGEKGKELFYFSF